MVLTIYEAWVMALAALVLGVLLLVYGGSKIVDAAVYVARNYGVSPLVIGFTILAFGTSFPELVISVLANFHGSAGIAIGNVVGSNIANVFMVLGVTALVVPLRVKVCGSMRRDMAVMLVSTVFLAAMLWIGSIGRVTGALMFSALCVYVYYQYRLSLREAETQEVDSEIDLHGFSGPLSAFLVLATGFFFIAAGAECLVQGAKVSASLIGVPDAVIALSVIALGTSLPELSTSIIAARKGQGEMVVGNIIGSNVFNILMIIGATSFVKPIEPGSFSSQLATFDVWVALFAAVVLVSLLVFFSRINRFSACLFVLCYLVYNVGIYGMNLR